MVLRAKEYQEFFEEYKKLLKSRYDEEEYFSKSKKRLKTINDNIKKLDKKLINS